MNMPEAGLKVMKPTKKKKKGEGRVVGAHGIGKKDFCAWGV